MSSVAACPSSFTYGTCPVPAVAAPQEPAAKRSVADRVMSRMLGISNRMRAGVAWAGEKAASVVASRMDSTIARATQRHFSERKQELDQQAQQLSRGEGLRHETHKILAGGQTAGTILRGSTIAAYAIGGGALPALAAYGMRAASTVSKIAVQATTEKTRQLSSEQQQRQFEQSTRDPKAGGWRSHAGRMLARVEEKLSRFTQNVEARQAEGKKVSTFKTIAAMLAKKQRQEIWQTVEDGRLKASAVAAVTASAVIGTLSTLTSLVMGGKSLEHLADQRDQLMLAAQSVVAETRSGISSALHSGGELFSHAVNADGAIDPNTPGMTTTTAAAVLAAANPAPGGNAAVHVLAEGSIHPGAAEYARGTGLAIDAKQDSISEVARRIASDNKLLASRASFRDALTHGTLNGKRVNLWNENVVHDGDTVRIIDDGGGKSHVEVVSRHAAGVPARAPVPVPASSPAAAALPIESTGPIATVESPYESTSSIVTEGAPIEPTSPIATAETPYDAVNPAAPGAPIDPPQTIATDGTPIESTDPIAEATSEGTVHDVIPTGESADATTPIAATGVISQSVADGTAETACYAAPYGVQLRLEHDGAGSISSTTTLNPLFHLKLDPQGGTGTLDVSNNGTPLAPTQQFRLDGSSVLEQSSFGSSYQTKLVDGHFIAVDAAGNELPRIDCATALADSSVAEVAAPVVTPDVGAVESDAATPVVASDIAGGENPISAEAPAAAAAVAEPFAPGEFSVQETWSIIELHGINQEDLSRAWDVVRQDPDTLLKLKAFEIAMEEAGKGTGDLAEKTAALRIFEEMPVSDENTGDTLLKHYLPSPEAFRKTTEGFYTLLRDATKDDLRTPGRIREYFGRTLAA